MKIIQDFSFQRKKIKKPIVAIGIFDGVHRGHQVLIQKTVQRAKKIGGTAVVMTFFPHPVHVLSKKKEMSLLVSLTHRLKLIKALGVSVCIVIRFTKKFANTSAESFVSKYLVEGLKAKEIFVGSNFHFGRARQGQGPFLRRMAKKHGFKVFILKSIRSHKKVISSSALRKMVAQGKLGSAEMFLNRPVSILGVVKKGDRRGRALGFPTANINPGREILPLQGVYVAQVRLGKKLYSALANIGKKPSFQKNSPIALEVHIFNFHQNIYGQEIEVKFLKRLRCEKIFRTPDALIHAMQCDKQKALAFFNEQRCS